LIYKKYAHAQLSNFYLCYKGSSKVMWPHNTKKKFPNNSCKPFLSILHFNLNF